jgi:hypothetical protein
MMWLVCLASLFFRLFILWLGGTPRPIGDEFEYLHLSGAVLKGKFPQARFMPGWPYLLGFFRWITPDRDVARLLIILMSVVSSCLVYLIAKKLSG